MSIEKGSIWRISIDTQWDTSDIAIGASIACNGICLSVVVKGPDWVKFEAGEETMKMTTLAGWKIDDEINLERALKVGDELGGHIVTGHIDGVGHVRSKKTVGGTVLVDIEAPQGLAPFIAKKGSIAVDGVSLTVNEVQGSLFSVGLLPITLDKTNFGHLQEGKPVNLEIDVLARYVARLKQAQED